MSEMTFSEKFVHDGRWHGYDTPPTGNANDAWILHMVSKLSENGVAGFCKKVTYKAGAKSEDIIKAFHTAHSVPTVPTITPYRSTQLAP